MNKKVFLITIGVIILIFGLQFTYQAGFERGEKAGLKAAYKDYEESGLVDNSTDKKQGIIYGVAKTQITIINGEKENTFDLTENVEVKEETDISPSEFDSVESDYLSKEEEYEEAKRKGELEDQLEEEYSYLKKEYQNIIKAAEDGEREISVNDLSKGQLVRLTLSDNKQITKIKVIEN